MIKNKMIYLLLLGFIAQLNSQQGQSPVSKTPPSVPPRAYPSPQLVKGAALSVAGQKKEALPKKGWWTLRQEKKAGEKVAKLEKLRLDYATLGETIQKRYPSGKLTSSDLKKDKEAKKFVDLRKKLASQTKDLIENKYVTEEKKAVVFDTAIKLNDKKIAEALKKSLNKLKSESKSIKTVKVEKSSEIKKPVQPETTGMTGGLGTGVPERIQPVGERKRVPKEDFGTTGGVGVAVMTQETVKPNLSKKPASVSDEIQQGVKLKKTGGIQHDALAPVRGVQKTESGQVAGLAEALAKRRAALTGQVADE